MASTWDMGGICHSCTCITQWELSVPVKYISKLLLKYYRKTRSLITTFAPQRGSKLLNCRSRPCERFERQGIMWFSLFDCFVWDNWNLDRLDIHWFRWIHVWLNNYRSFQPVETMLPAPTYMVKWLNCGLANLFFS